MPPVIEVPQAPSPKNPAVDGIQRTKLSGMTMALAAGRNRSWHQHGGCSLASWVEFREEGRREVWSGCSPA